MEWSRTETLALAMPRCTHCHGYGMRASRGSHVYPCNCVLRAIFRICYDRFCDCVTKEKHISRTRMEFSGGRDTRFTWGRKEEEYAADFILVSRRTLTPEEYQLFNFHFLLGADWRLCCRRLKMDRGVLFHTIYRIQQKLGKVFRELQPYGLYPLDEYFHGTTGQQTRAIELKAVPIRVGPLPESLEFPRRKAA